MEQEDDFNDFKRNRQTREEVRRRNREIMERANAELRESKPTSAGMSAGMPNKRDTSRLPLIRQFQEGQQTFLCDFRFHTSTPILAFGPIKVDLDIKASDFCDFSAESAASMFNECLKSVSLVDVGQITYLDLLNPDEAYPKPSASESFLHPEDEALLTNDLMAGASAADGSMVDSGVYTGHFLRKPQLMSNDLFAEGAGGVSRKVGGSISTSMVGRNRDRSLSPEAFDEIAREFDHAKQIDRLFAKNELIDNPIAKKPMRAKRVLNVVPDDHNRGDYHQFKFVDEKVSRANVFDYLLTNDLCLYEQNSSDFPKRYKKKRQLVRGNRSTVENTGEDFFMIKLPLDGSDKCQLKAVGPKILLKKDIRVAGTAAGANDREVVLHESN